MLGRISSWRAPGSGGVPIPWVSKRHGDKWWDSVDGLGGPEGLLQEGFMVCKANCCSISPGSIAPSCAEGHHQLFPDLVLSHLTTDGEKQRQDSTFPRVDMSPVSTSMGNCPTVVSYTPSPAPLWPPNTLTIPSLAARGHPTTPNIWLRRRVTCRY